MTEKMGNTEHKEEDSFALYTEKIVPKPSVKYRRLIRAAKFFAAAEKALQKSLCADSDCKRCDASCISGIGKKIGSEEYGQRNSDH